MGIETTAMKLEIPSKSDGVEEEMEAISILSRAQSDQ